MFFFLKQKAAYEMRISDWSSDVCSSDLGSDIRLRFGPATPDDHAMMIRAEQGHYDAQGHWVFERVWNGDQTDYGLNFTTAPVMLRVTMGRFRRCADGCWRGSQRSGWRAVRRQAR